MFSFDNATISLTPVPPVDQGRTRNLRPIVVLSELGVNERIAQLIQNQLFDGKQNLHRSSPAAKYYMIS
jgi:hypothetical protein